MHRSRGPDEEGGGPRGGSFGTSQDPVHRRMKFLRKTMRDMKEGLPLGPLPHWTREGRSAPTRAEGITLSRGPADNPLVFEKLTISGGGTLPVILRTLNLPPFSMSVMASYTLEIRGVIVAYIICVLRVPRTQGQKQQLMAEVFVPELKVGSLLEEEEAIDVAQKCLRNYTAMRDSSWIRELMTQAIAAIPTGTDKAAHWTSRFIMDPFGWAKGVTLEEQLDYLYRLTEYADDRLRARVMGVVLTMLTAFAVRGTITHTKLAKVVTDMAGVIPYAGEVLNHSDIVQTWANFGHLVDDRTMPAVMRRWLAQVPAAAIRLRVLLAQAAGSGLTSVDVIARAVHEHPEFPWPLVVRVYPQEWEAAGRAICAVGNNPYYGYRRDLSQVKSTLFKRLSAFCGRLLMATGDKTLETYRGFVDDKINKDILQKLIDAYVATHEGANIDKDFEDHESSAYMFMREIVKAYPVNLEGFSNMGGHRDWWRDEGERDPDPPGPKEKPPPKSSRKEEETRGPTDPGPGRGRSRRRSTPGPSFPGRPGGGSWWEQSAPPGPSASRPQPPPRQDRREDKWEHSMDEGADEGDVHEGKEYADEEEEDGGCRDG